MLIKKLGVSLIFSLFLTALTNAAQVTSNSDDGEGSLRQVISDSEEGDTITFSDSFTITIATPITIDKDIVIDGGNVVKISGGGATSILKINSGNVVIKNIILKDGLAKGGNGGVGRHEGKHGGGGGGAGMGGAIYAVDGVVAIENVFFLYNKAVGGNGGATTNTKWVTDYAGRGGNSSLGSGGGRGGNFDAVRNRRFELPGKRGGFGGGGGGGANILHFGATGGMGAKGGFGGGAGGSAYCAYSNLSRLTGRYQIARGGQFGGDGGRETGAEDSAGSGGGGAGLGGALFIQGATVTIKDCSFIDNAVQSGVAGAVYKGVVGTAGQAVGGAIFVYQDAVFNSYGGVFYRGNSAQTSDDNYYIMEGAEYDTAPPVVAGTFNGEVTEKNEGEESKVSGTITVSDADADDNPQFEDIEIEDNYGSFSLVDGNWNYTLDQSKVQGLSQGDFISNKIKLTATDGTEQLITIKINGSNLVATPAVGNAMEDGISTSGQLIARDDNEADLKFSLVSNIAGLTINTDGSWTFEATDEVYQSIALGKTRDVVANWKVEDESLGDSVTSTLTIAVTGANDKPVAVAATNEALAGSAPPSDGSTSFDLLWVSEEDKSQTISMTMKFAKDTLGNPPETGFGNSVDGSVLTINYEGETTVHNDPGIIFSAETTLDYSKELIGQPGFGPDEGGDFNLFGVEVAEGNFDGFDRFTVMAPNGSRYTLVSMKPSGNVPPADGSTSFGLTWRNEEDNSQIMSMTMKFAKDTLGNPPETGFGNSVDGSVLTINYEGETTVHNDPEIIFSAESTLDYSKELIGQPGFGPEEGGDFNLFGVEVADGNFNGFARFTVMAPNGSRFTLISMKQIQSSAVSGQLVADDVDNDARLKFSLDEPVLGLTINEDGSYMFDGSDEIYESLWEGRSIEIIANWTVTDEHGAADSGELRITVNGVGEKPEDTESPKIVLSRDGGTISSLTLGFNSKAGTQYKIMYSEDLSNWEVLKNVQSIGETTEVSIDIQTDNFKSLFYKVRETFE